MKDTIPSFNKLEKGEIVPIGYHRVNYHNIFGVKMEYFRRKARLVAVVHVTEPTDAITYAIIVSRETVSIAMVLAALNDLPVELADIHNTYITEPIIDKIWIVLGQNLGGYYGRKAIVVYVLYGLNIAVYVFRNHLTYCMHHLVFLPCPYDLDIWINPMMRPKDGFDYYTYVLIYVENLMVIHHGS